MAGRGGVNYPGMEFRCFLVGKTEPLQVSEEELSFRKIKLMPKYIGGGEEEMGLVRRLCETSR